MIENVGTMIENVGTMIERFDTMIERFDTMSERCDTMIQNISHIPKKNVLLDYPLVGITPTPPSRKKDFLTDKL